MLIKVRKYHIIAIFAGLQVLLMGRDHSSRVEGSGSMLKLVFQRLPWVGLGY